MIENATQFMQFSWLTNISKSDPQRDRKFTSHADRKLFQFRLHIRTQNSKRQNPMRFLRLFSNTLSQLQKLKKAKKLSGFCETKIYFNFTRKKK
jgi:hypothetical protein